MNRIIINLKSKVGMSLVACFIAVSIIGCEKYTIEGPVLPSTYTGSFKTDILPILTKNNCASCHSGAQVPDLRDAKAYSSITVGDKNGSFVSVSSPDKSRLYVQLVTKHLGKSLPVDNLVILTWIKDGAKN